MQLRRKLKEKNSLRSNIQKSGKKVQNSTFLQTALQSSERPSTPAVHPDFVETFLHSKHKNSADIVKTYLSNKLPSRLVISFGIKDVSKRNGRDFDCPRSEAELVQALFDVFPDISHYYRYSHNKFYRCDAKTNIWDSMTNDDFYSHIRQVLERRIRLTKDELINICTNDTILKIGDIIMSKIVDVDFTEQLDSVSNIFVTNNKAIDMSIVPPVIRNIKCEDLIKNTSGWTYDPELSYKYKISVRSYFHKLLPKPCEQKWFLSFIARMLNGKRCKEPCVILTDNCGGKSGKSTLIQLLRAVFGHYYLNDSTTVVARGKKNINPRSLENKRLFVVDGLEKNETLNYEFIKSIINSECRNRRSIFPVNSGLILVSNIGMPKLDTNDEDFLKRIVICSMRSKFVREQEIAYMKEHEKDITDTCIADIKEFVVIAYVHYIL